MDIEEELPPLEKLEEMSANIRKAHRIITTAYRHSVFALQASDSDPHRLRDHSSRLLNRVLPIMQAMERQIPEHMAWLLRTTTLCCELITELEGAAANAQQRFVQITELADFAPDFH